MVHKMIIIYKRDSTLIWWTGLGLLLDQSWPTDHMFDTSAVEEEPEIFLTGSFLCSPDILMLVIIRRWFLDTVVEVTDGRVLKFLKNRFKAGDISANEAGQAILVAFNHLSAESELVEMAKVKTGYFYF